jgi:hypothetical protein
VSTPYGPNLASNIENSTLKPTPCTTIHYFGDLMGKLGLGRETLRLPPETALNNNDEIAFIESIAL